MIQGFAVTFREVPGYQFSAYLGTAQRFYGEEAFEAVQLVYPDREGRWPWQEGVTEEFRAAEPVLAEMPLPAWAREDGSGQAAS